MTPRLKVKMTRRKGRGVFANCNIKKGETIEIAPVVVLSQRQAKELNKLNIVNFCYQWGRRGNFTALVMGFAPFYNHSYHPNAEYQHQPQRKAIRFFAIKNIVKGQEVTHNYNGSPDDRSPIKFTKNSWEFV